ncbi:hypothetical protein [Streptomyces sp. NBC_00878]|uniref:hypothetical protein n=1 Tax=Streptomyces sp. NBC_00878 TaxID=2975854 RepID=UPI002257D152|nr:hypothetical protein [Streptomyces sp. NBC_00878]MCX4911798.1 hypothetical protein [Streptomyces sp. NBC_00878]
MSEWNLSVRLTGQGSDLKGTLRDSAKEARKLRDRINEAKQALTELRAAAANDITVRLDIDAGHLRSDVNAALTTAGSGQGLRVRLDIDDADLHSDIQAALAGASGQALTVRLDVDGDHLRDEVTAAVTAAGADQSITVGLNVDGTAGLAALQSASQDTAHSLNTLQRAAREAKNELEELQTQAVLTASAVRRISTAAGRARTRLDDLSTGTRTFRSDLDDLDGSLTNVNGRLGDLRGRVGGLTASNQQAGQSVRGLLALFTGLATAAVPLTAGLSTALIPLGGALGSAAVGATAFGIAIGGQVERLGQVADAEKKYQDAVSEHGKASTEAITAQLTYQRALAELPPEAQKAAIAVSRLKGNFSDWSDDMATWTMKPLTQGITVLDQIIPRLTPHVQSASAQLDRLTTVAGGAMATPGFDAMANRFADFSDRQLDAMTDKVMHFLRVLSEGGALKSGPLAQFMDYARTNGPAAREALSAISDAVVMLLKAASEAGPTMLTLVTAAARLVAALPPELVGIIIQVATALKLLQLSGAGMAALAGGMAAVQARIAALGTTAAAAGGGLAGLRAAFMSLGVAARASIIVAGIAAVVVVLSSLSKMGKEAPPNVEKLTTSLGELGQTGKVTGEALRAFGPQLEGLGESLRTLARPSNLDKTQQFLTKLVGMDSTPVKEAKEDLDAVDKSLANLVRGGKGEIAAAAFERVAEAMRKQGMSGKELRAQLGDYKSALADQAFEQELAAQSMGIFGQAAQDTSAKLADQKASADGLRQSLQALNDVNRAGASAMSAFEQSLDDVQKASGKFGGVLKMQNGELDLGSGKAREAEKVLSDLAANTDAAAASARDQGKSWQQVNAIYTEGRTAFIQAADAMGLTKAQAEALANSYLKIPEKKSVTLEMRTEDAIAGLNSVISAIEKTPNAKSVTVSALTSDAVSMLESLGFKVVQLKDGKFKVTAETGAAGAGLDALKGKRDGLKDKTLAINATTQDAIADLEAVKSKVASTNGKTITMKAPTAEARQQLEALGFKIRDTKGKNVVISVPTGTQRANVGSLASAIAGLRNRSVTVTYTTVYKIKGSPGGPPSGTYYGSTAGRSADGNIYAGARLQRFADGGMGRENHVAQIAQPTYRMWAEPETGGEAYIPFASSKRPRSRAIAEETVRRLGGNPDDIQWNAQGSVTDWRYDPTTGSLYSASDAGSAGNKTKKVKVKVKGKTTTKEVNYFDVGAVEKKLISAGRATAAWNRDLEKVAATAGGDVAEALASMGKDGVALTKKMANGSKKYIAQMSIALRQLAKEARASLTDYKVQLNHATGNQELFAKNLAKLAAQGFGDLAGQLAAQNDEAAQQLAASAASDSKKASAANAAAKRANNALTPDQVQSLVSIIAAVKNSKTGIHDVAATTGLGEDEIIATATKATSQIKTALGSRSTRFLADLGKAQKGMAYADGGIRSGIYATRGGAVTFAEPSTGGEAYLPLGANKRRHAMPVLRDVASRFGVGLTDANAGRVVIIREQGPLIGSQTWQVTSGGNAEDTARKVDAHNGYQLRRLARGGVGARGQ